MTTTPEERRGIPATLFALLLLIGGLLALLSMSAWTQDKEGVIDDRLVGRWVTDPSDVAGIQEYGWITQEFGADGRSKYTIHAPDKDYVMLLTYRTEDGMLITDQPSAPREERTAYSFTPEGKLVLVYEGQRSYYVREPE